MAENEDARVQWMSFDPQDLGRMRCNMCGWETDWRAMGKTTRTGGCKATAAKGIVCLDPITIAFSLGASFGVSMVVNWRGERSALGLTVSERRGQ